MTEKYEVIAQMNDNGTFRKNGFTIAGWQAEYVLLGEIEEGPHTYYLDVNGEVSSTNLDTVK